MDVCDKVTGEDSGAKDAVASMIKRLAHRNANVQLYTLEVRNVPALITLFPLMARIACQCAQPKLWPQDASRTCLKSFHRCLIAVSERPKHTSAS
jgi:hypothetical protein